MYMGSSLVGSTHAESACLRSHALLLLSKLQGRGREDMEGGVGGLLKGLCSYLNLQGHIGSNMTRAWMTRSWPRAWNDEVNRIGGSPRQQRKERGSSSAAFWHVATCRAFFTLIRFSPAMSKRESEGWDVGLEFCCGVGGTRPSYISCSCRPRC